ncbi:TRAP dicarboxylate transporter-DctP subunit [Candidatus Vecturithrix granuli]|uniref:TRAP dicarboxylate transporter-DctP subunit n=1 Tax=Vecturithrix granuli TaxID=1499967 RepID=A0A081BWY4_VECG1|nr:TRAP dicarboxylate transporter-DctP subunit [Candidatus Vecturithrix granuli]
MKRLVVSLLVLCTVVAFTQIPVMAEDEYVFKYAHSQTDAHPRSKSMVFFKEELEKASGGKIKVELYTSGVLGKEDEVLDMVKMGTVQGTRGGLFERANKMYLLYTLPFMFENTDQILKLIRGEFGDKVNAGALANGFYIPACGVAGGFRNVTNKVRPIATVADIKGLKMRTPPIDMTVKTFAALGANPQSVPYGETYMALKQGVVDGQENPFSNTVDMKFYEVQKYLSVINWQVHPDPFYVNPAWYNKLPDDLKKIFDATAKATLEYSDKIWLASEDEYFKTLQQHLEVNTLTPEARAGFVEAVKPVWQGYVDSGTFTWDDINAALKIAQGQ